VTLIVFILRLLLISRFLWASFSAHPAAGDQAKHGSLCAPAQELNLPFPAGGAMKAARYRRRGSPEACAAIAAIREPYAATIATLPCLESDAITQFAIRHIAPGNTIITGRASRFDGLGVAGFVQTREPQTNPEDPFTRPRFVDQLAKHLDSCMKKVHHAQVSECNLPEYFAEFSFRFTYADKSVGRRFYKLLQTILK
jgi:hypothetical protein